MITFLSRRGGIAHAVGMIALLASCATTPGSGEATDDQMAAGITLERIGVYLSGAGFDDGGAEIAAYDPATMRLFSTNGDTDEIDIIDLSDPTNPARIGGISPAADQPGADAANSVYFANGMLLAAVEADEDGANGFAMMYDADGAFLGSVEIGNLPDMIGATPDGRLAVVALEAEPYVANGDEIVDPAGGVAIVDLTAMTAEIVTFDGAPVFNEESVRTPLADFMGNPAYLDFEPEYIAFSADGATAFAGLQENNAVAVIDLASATVEGVYGLGLKDHSLAGNGLDANNDDGVAGIEPAPFFAAKLPDSIAAYTAADGRTYVVTANEGDDREIEDEAEESVLYTDLGEFDDLGADDLAPGYAIDLSRYPGKEFLLDMGLNSDGRYEQLVVGGARSFSIYRADDMTEVFDSGDAFERYFAANYPETFNASDDDLAFDSRSDDGGPDPEGLTLGVVNGRTYAFIGMEKFGGVMVFDVTVPEESTLVTYATGRNHRAVVNADGEYDDTSYANTGDLAPEGLVFIAAADSPTGNPLLTVSNEISGSIEIYEIR